MNVPLDIVRLTGRAPVQIEAEVLRELNAADLVLLATERGVKPTPIMRLRERHHALARNLASGMTDGEAAAICGYELSRVSILKGDPTFKELVLFYREDVKRAYAQVHEVLSGMAVDAAIIIRERMEDTPDELSSSLLTEIVKMSADRTGYGPSSKQEVNVNFNLANRLEEARKRIAARAIDLTPERVANG
jgi:hypothetical protein